MKLALLTCSKFPELIEADRKLLPLLLEKGYETEIVVWDQPKIKWESFDCLIFRNTWDYYEKEEEFRKWLEKLNSQKLKTVNPLTLIQWNLHKFYLKELEEKGIPILKTFFLEKGNFFDFENQVPQEMDELVLKPAFSAGSYLTIKFKRESWKQVFQTYKEHFSNKDFLLQPFRPEIQSLGETSMIFFNGRFSHAVNKKPKENDFRVQVQYGGIYNSFQPTSVLIQQAKKVIHALPQQSMYARVDGIVKEGAFELMEIELIEPDLYFNIVPDAKLRFVNAIDEWLLKSS
ncbi:MAG: RimK family alpha-L-glutamate ligase [Flavobacterium sp.]